MDRLFTNIESVCDLSADLLQRLQDAIADPDPETQLIGNFDIYFKQAYSAIINVLLWNS